MAKKSLLSKAQAAQGAAGAQGRATGARGRPAARPGYDRKKANRISLWTVLAAALAFSVYMAVELSIDPASVAGGVLRVRALFGFSLPVSEIQELKLETAPIVLGTRIVALDAFGLFREGDYQVEGLGQSRVFLKKPYSSYLTIRTSDKNYAISLGSAEKDQLLYDAIKLAMK
jgi:hypothetical protein